MSCNLRFWATGVSRWPRMTLLMLLLLGTQTLGALAQGGAILATDKDDYLPGEVVYLGGAGFQGGEPIDLSITIENPFTGTRVADFAWAGFNAEADGSFLATFVVPEEALEMTLIATAMGLNSALVASVTFQDHGPSPVSASSYSIDASGNVSVVLGGGSSTVTLSDATIKIDGTPTPGAFDVTLTGPGGNGNGTWTGSFAPDCEITYQINNVRVTWATTHDHSSTLTPAAAGEGTVSVTTGDCSPPPPCPTNSAPTISASSLDLGNVVGCLVGDSFEITVDVAPADFSPVTNDPDGDPVSVTASVSSVTLVGPGLAEVEVTLTATDDPSARNVVGCDELVALSAETTVKVKARVVYAWGGFGPPLSETVARSVKRGSTVPVKFHIYDCSGIEICSGGPHTIAVFFSQGIAPSGDAEVADSGSSNNNGNEFRYSGTCGVDGNWIYNLQTNTSYALNATYKICVTLDDGTTHDVLIAIKK